MQHEKTKLILHWFERISQIPRNSKEEEAIAAAIVLWSGEYGFATRQDKVGNLVIEVPGTEGYENSPTVVIQGHMDMVCEKAKGSTHDFTKDPIKHIYEGDWLRADNTTLGADNGIAIAMALVAATEKDVAHPPLELLFTVDEETGLTGANSLQPGFISGKILLNVDSEDEGVFTVGCAGGRDTHITMAIETEVAPDGYEAIDVVVEGFRGGHSGVDIHEQRGNAVRTLARMLRIMLDVSDIRIVKMLGGTAHNAIPRDAEATLFVRSSDLGNLKAAIAKLDAAIKAEHVKTDPRATVYIEAGASADRGEAWTASCTQQGIDLALAIPNGVDTFSNDIAGLVETSNNLATIRTVDGSLVFHTSQRSSVMDRLDLLTRRIEAIGNLCPIAVAESDGGYPSWEPNMDSALLDRCKGIYTKLFDKPPVIEIIHAGLECGIIGDKNEGMDMISFGPTIENPHSPDERISLPTIGLVWDFMEALLKDLK